jgi:hypothetical protein
MSGRENARTGILGSNEGSPMLQIREEHMAIFEERERELFEKRVVSHLERIWPARCGSLGSPAVLAVVRAGMGSSRRYGIVAELDVVRYIDLAFLLGPNFDRDPRLAWAGESLSNAALRPREKLDRVYARLRAELQPPSAASPAAASTNRR